MISNKPLIRAPNRRLRQWLDRMLLPIFMLVTFGGLLNLIPYRRIWMLGMQWLLQGVALIAIELMARYLLRWRINLKFLPILRFIALYIILIWEGNLLIISSIYIPVSVVASIWPILLFPTFLIARQNAESRHLTSIVVLTIFTGIFMLTVSGLISVGIMTLPTNATNFNIEFRSQLSHWFTGLLPAALYGISALMMYYLLRRAQLGQITYQILQDVSDELNPIVQHVTNDLSQIAGIPVSMQRCAEILQTRLRYARVVLLAHDPITGDIAIRGVAGKGVEQVDLSVLPASKGISRSVIESGRARYVPDVSKERDFESKNLPAHGSELSVQIRSQLPRGELRVLGALNFQEDFPNAFSEVDMQMAKQVAELIGARLGFESLEIIQQQLNVLATKLCELDHPQDIVDVGMLAIQKMLNPSAIVYFRLGAGTSIPLPNPTILGTTYAIEFWKSPAIRASNSNLVEWIYRGETRLIQSRDFLRLKNGGMGFGVDFQQSEEAKALAFLPLGMPNMLRGVILLIFREPQPYMVSSQIALQTIAHALTPHLDRAEHLNTIFENFGRPRLHLHGILGIAGLGRGTWEKRLDAIQSKLNQKLSEDTDPNDRREALEHVSLLRQGLQAIISRTRAEETMQLPTFRYRTLVEVLREEVYGPFAQQFGKIPISSIDPRIEQENRDLKLILYCVISEAVTNAYLHGKPRRVQIKLRRNYDQIVIKVSDDGCGFNISKHENGQDGIFELLHRLKKYMCADYNWGETAPGRGTHLSVFIPALPNVEGI